MAKDKEWTMDTIIKKADLPQHDPTPEAERLMNSNKGNRKETKMAKNGNGNNGKKELISVDMPFDRDTKGFFVYSRSDKKLFPVYIPRALVDDKAPPSITVTITVGT